MGAYWNAGRNGAGDKAGSSTSRSSSSQKGLWTTSSVWDFETWKLNSSDTLPPRSWYLLQVGKLPSSATSYESMRPLLSNHQTCLLMFIASLFTVAGKEICVDALWIMDGQEKWGAHMQFYSAVKKIKRKSWNFRSMVGNGKYYTWLQLDTER